tara:strand:- start:3422 stop:4981 length:1560 start_codon:yes stop_codon:yes gene_type:complete
MRENYTPKLVLIVLVLLTSLYVALPSLGVFPKVGDFDRNGIINEVDFKEYHRVRVQADEALLTKYDLNKDGNLIGAEWEKCFDENRESMGLTKDPRFARRFFSPKEITLGLDLQGGIDLIYRIESDEELKTKAERKDLIRKTILVLKNRIDILGITEPVVQPYNDDHIRVQLAGRFDEKQVKSIIGQTDLLKFQWVVDFADSALSFGSRAQNPEYEIIRKTAEVSKDGTVTESGGWYLLQRKTVVTGDEIHSAFTRFNEFGKPEIGLKFRDSGASKLANATKSMIGQRLAIVLGGEVYMAPTVQSQLASDVTVEGSFDLEYVKGIVGVLRAGSLPAKLVPVLENRVGATLGQDAVQRGFVAGKWGFLMVFVAMFLIYRFAGVFANIALLFNLLLVIAVMVFMGATLTLPGIAGLILTVGMAVDANVLIFERVREELRSGKSIRAAIDAGFSKAFTAILDANVTSLFTCIVLFKFGSGPIQGFAVTLAIGILASMFTAIFVVKTLLASYYGNSDSKTISI